MRLREDTNVTEMTVPSCTTDQTWNKSLTTRVLKRMKMFVSSTDVYDHQQSNTQLGMKLCVLAFCLTVWLALANGRGLYRLIKVQPFMFPTFSRAQAFHRTVSGLPFANQIPRRTFISSDIDDSLHFSRIQPMHSIGGLNTLSGFSGSRNFQFGGHTPTLIGHENSLHGPIVGGDHQSGLSAFDNSLFQSASVHHVQPSYFGQYYVQNNLPSLSTSY